MLEGTEILTTAQMRATESAAIDSGAVTGLDLMERAGAAVAGHIRLRWPKPGRVTVLCGPGNNGGDGYVIARHLTQAGWRVRVLGMDNTPGPDAAEMRRRWAAIGAILPLTTPLPPADLTIDALFGTGLTRPVPDAVAAILAACPAPVVAVDCPSGLCLDSGRLLGPIGARPAGLTVAFHRPKIGHLIGEGPMLCGPVVIADIGLSSVPQISPPEASTITAGATAAVLRKQAGHKFAHGHALIVAGGIAHGGAARLAARAALRIGAGLVTICPPKSALIEHAGPPDALMRRGLDDADALAAMLADRRINAVALGPGCGVDRAAGLLPALLGAGRSCVLDADALTALAGAPLDLHETCVLTPHGGEFARLFPDLADRLAQAPATGPAYSKLDATRAAAARAGATVLLKGPDTVIAAPDGRARIHSAFDIPWLATAGAGDVLAGIIAGLLARGLPPLDAAATGALIHAGAARRFGPGLIADDLPDRIPGVLSDLGL